MTDPRVQLATMLGAFVAGTLVAELAGAANLGIALSFGSLAFAAVLLVNLARG
ncbi:hypothetical protein HJD18_11060 [Thermoleophilia bacterium SCSIO 60948]|nr:hypothetical protein HJD18_11060 [Thermoleophilia bacterium SCSIO 60948]